MAGPSPRDDGEDDKPLDPAVEKVRRKMVRFFAINIGILMLALMAVLAAIVYKSTRSDNKAGRVNAVVPNGAPANAALPLAADERIASQSLSGDRLSVLLEKNGMASRIVILDVVSGRILTEIELTR